MIDWSKYDEGTVVANKVPEEVTKQLPGLPANQRIEEHIAGRTDLMSRGAENMARGLRMTKDLGQPGQGGVSASIGGLQVPLGLIQRGEAGLVGNPVLEIQRMQAEGLRPGETAADYFINPLKESIKGFKGERLGEMGDPFKKLFTNKYVGNTVGALMGLMGLNIVTGGAGTKGVKKVTSGFNKKAVDAAADSNTQKFVQGLLKVKQGLKDTAKRAIEPFKQNRTTYTADDLIDNIPAAHADTLVKAAKRVGRTVKQTTSQILDETGKRMQQKLTIKQLSDFTKDIQTYIDDLFRQSKDPTGKAAPNVEDLIKLKDTVKSWAMNSLGDDAAKESIESAFKIYGDDIGNVNQALWRSGYSKLTKRGDSKSIAKYLKDPTEASLRNMINGLVSSDKSIQKALASLGKWQRRVAPLKSGITLPGVAGAAALGSSLAGKLFDKGKTVLAPNSGTVDPKGFYS